jgi:hypothetical protein
MSNVNIELSFTCIDTDVNLVLIIFAIHNKLTLPCY